MDLHSELAQAMELVEAGDAGSDNDRVELHVFLPSSRVARVSPRWSEAQSRDLVSARERPVVERRSLRSAKARGLPRADRAPVGTTSLPTPAPEGGGLGRGNCRRTDRGGGHN